MEHYPTRFEAYPSERLIEIAIAWADHAWPITVEQAQRVYESLGYHAYPPDPSLFISDLSADGEPDSYYTATGKHINSIRPAIARRCPLEEEARYAALVSGTYAKYRSAFDSTFNRATKHVRGSRSDEWTLDNDVRFRIGDIGTTITFVIHSPRMTQLRREEEEMGLTSYDDILEDD